MMLISSRPLIRTGLRSPLQTVPRSRATRSRRLLRVSSRLTGRSANGKSGGHPDDPPGGTTDAWLATPTHLATLFLRQWWVKERQPWEEVDYDEIQVTDNFGQRELIRIPHGGGGHGGGDVRLRDRIFRDPDAPDPYLQAAGLRDGVMSGLIGFAAGISSDTGDRVRIADLTSLTPQAARPRGYPSC
jgi:hypothetical protein